jgi:hypothetical protein
MHKSQERMQGNPAEVGLAVSDAKAAEYGAHRQHIVKEVFVSLFEPDGLAQLLQRPGGTWMGGDVTMDQAPAVVLDHHEHVQQPERGGDGN